MTRFLGVIFALLTSAASLHAAHTQASLLLDSAAAKPGSTITAAVHLKMESSWHTYWKNPGDSGKATKIDWDLPAGITAGEIQWQVPEKDNLEGIFTYIFKNETALLVPLTIGPSVSPGSITLKAKVSWLECEKVCVPAKQNVEATLAIASEPKPSADADRIKDWQSKIPKPATDLQLTANWDGPAKDDTRAIIFTVNKTPASSSLAPSDGERAGARGSWDFFNYPLEDSQLSGKTESLPAAAGKVSFRKNVTKFEGWPTNFTGLALISSDPKSAAVVTVAIGNSEPAAPATAKPTAAAKPETTLPVATASSSAKSQTFLGLLLSAFLGGLILNIMPCVLPVISLKILGFVRQSNQDTKQIRVLGLIYSLGVIVSFLALATFVILIKQAGKAASWGMQFQNPQFLILMTLLVTLVAMNLFGVFEITLGGGALTTAGNLASREGKSGAFFNGVLATILATPCTAPFLGAALGFAFLASNGIILITFLFVAFGLAAPYLLLCWYPAWLKKLPRPGAWMEKFKNAMGFPMLATAIWLFSVAVLHFPKGAALNLGLFLVVVSLAAWIFGEFVQRGSKRRGLASGITVALLVVAFGYFLENQLDWRHPPRNASRNIAVESGGILWRPWNPTAVQLARSGGQPVIIDFTADWCLICQANKKTSLEIPSVREKIKQLNVAPFLADNTFEDAAIIAEIQKYQRAGVPLVLILPADPKGAPIVLPEVLTPTLVLDALDKAAKPISTASARP